MFGNIDFAMAVSRLSITFLPFILAMTVHELAHAWAARRCGDNTAYAYGRVTLNPLSHIDPMGLICYVATSLTGGLVFGWAKPVPINPGQFRHLNRDMALVSAAGPVSNFFLAVISAILLRLTIELTPEEGYFTTSLAPFVVNMLYTSVLLNFSLGWFNLMPIPPLDGSKIVWSVLPARLGFQYMRLESMGMVLVFLLAMTGVFRFVLLPLVSQSTRFVLTAVGLSA